MDMIERIKQAIAETPGFDDEPIGKTLSRHELHDAAIAALKALREPTPAMVDRFVSRALQVSVHSEGGWSDYAHNQWQAMIDGALAGEGKGE